MIGSLFSGLVGRFTGGALTKVLLAFCAVLITALVFTWVAYKTESADNTVLTNANVQLEADKQKALTALTLLQQEITRTQAIEDNRNKKEVKIEYVERVITNEVTKWRDRPGRVRVYLSGEWVCSYNASVRMPSFDNIGQISTESRESGTYTCNNYVPVEEADALPAIVRNNIRYYKLQNDYNSLLEIVRGYNPTPVEVGHAKKQ
jgi:nitrogen fixation protein FixH